MVKHYLDYFLHDLFDKIMLCLEDAIRAKNVADNSKGQHSIKLTT
jgi:hypothetical protein